MHAVPAPHALCRIDAPTDWPGAPAWAIASLARAPWVVVRRAPLGDGGQWPVGVRGARCAERWADWINPARVTCVLSPFELVVCDALGQRPMLEVARRRRPTLPAWSLLDGVAGVCETARLRWGPAGGAGFELATGVPALTAESDLDLAIDVPQPVSHAWAYRLLEALRQCGAAYDVRIDAQMQVPRGAVALADYAGAAAAGRVLLRTALGSILVNDPWEGV